MGTSHHIYLGPYAKCKIERVAGSSIGCSSAVCRDYRVYVSTPFCALCGSACKKFEVPDAREKIDGYELFKREEPLSSYQSHDGKHRFFVPNQGRGALRQFRFEPMREEFDEVFYPNGVNAIQLDVVWFEKAFGKEISVLKEAYKKCIVEWGLFSYTM